MMTFQAHHSLEVKSIGDETEEQKTMARRSTLHDFYVVYGMVYCTVRRKQARLAIMRDLVIKIRDICNISTKGVRDIVIWKCQHAI